MVLAETAATHSHGYAIVRAVIQTERRPEERAVLAWRYDELVRAGYPERVAMLLADRADVDLHRATALVAAGCPPKTAVRILL